MSETNLRAEFEKLAIQGKILTKHVEPLVALTENRYCYHKHWGFGKITTVDTVFARFAIDFKDRPNHQMDLNFAAETLKPIPPTHILARKAMNLEELRQMAALHHLELIKLVLNSFGGKASLDQIQQLLVPDVINADWRKWWEAARAEMKKDGHFIIPVKKTDPIIYKEETVSPRERLLQEFRTAKGLKARNAVAQQMLRSLSDLPEPEALVKEVCAALNAEIVNYQRTQPATALDAIFTRDDLRKAVNLPAEPGEVTEAAIWNQSEAQVAAVLEAAPAPRHRRMLQSFQAAHPETWAQDLLAAINGVSVKLVTELAHILLHEHKLDELKMCLSRLISQHQASSDLLLWLAKERSDTFADILGPEVFRAMLSAIERDQFSERKSNRLRDYIVDDQELLVELISSADIEVIKDLTRALQLSPCFDDMDKRSLLARIVKSYPDMQSLITGEQTRQDNYFLVSWESLERRRNEYNELVQKKIPANAREIAIARSYGDLRENHEYKAAKEMQKLLMRRKAELEHQIQHARGTDFANASTEAVSIGTRVTVTDLETQHVETYTILGAWDTDADRGIVSYLSPIGKALIGKKVGEEAEIEGEHHHNRRFRIESITRAFEPEAEPATAPLAAPVIPASPPAEAAPAGTDAALPDKASAMSAPQTQNA
ncbi:GreA/GreB family elongation factor [Fontisphaera persica]|uniref:GreA/GreB family elongation factor n=1 Tax=Fontisphaera persica TaxID=2974023 RepID=UPI0024C0D083|nr:GreA/GreB family elongation factor [Fontisphaera persica]WCJ58479.1 GreA/GreB family elongation factor [Fontisphaera persica]